MYKLELYANYMLKDHLPKEVRNAFPAKVEKSKGNTILLEFKEFTEREKFASMCRRLGFEYKIS